MRLAWLAVAAIAIAPLAARADDFRAAIDRVDLEPSSLGGNRLRIYLSALTVQGQILDLTESKSIKLYVGTSEKKEPFSIGRYGQLADADTAIVFVVQVTGDFQPVLPAISDALDAQVLAPMNDHTQAAVLTYGDAVGAGKLATAKATHSKLTNLQSDGSASDPALLDTIERGLRLLRDAKTEPEGRPMRKLIVVIGDGRDRSNDHDRVTRVGKRAAKEGVRIDAMGFSPNDVRRPLFLLGELSKQSLGTYRWVRGKGADSWNGAAEQLHDEVAKQYVLTYFLAADDEVANKKVKVVAVGRTEVTSNEMKIPAESTCGGATCELGQYCAADHCVAVAANNGRGFLGWILLIGGVGVGALVVLGFVGYLIQRQKEPPFPFPGQHPGLPPGAVPGQPVVAPAVVAPIIAGAPGSVPPQGFFPPPGKKPKKQKRGKEPSMPPPVAVQAAPVAAPVQHGPWLFVMTGPRTGERIALRHGFWIGKATGCDFVIDDGYASSQHAQLGQDTSGAYWVYDRGSTNGTFVNGVRVLEQSLAHNAVVQVGSMQMRFLTE